MQELNHEKKHSMGVREREIDHMSFIKVHTKCLLGCVNCNDKM